jgi:PAS domain S-box-containing protein
LLEAAGVGAFGVLFYSYSTEWFALRHPSEPSRRVLVNGLAFGALTVLLMISRIQVGEDRFIDARHVPLALIALFEGWPTGLVAAVPPVLYRLWQGGPGAWAGVIGLVATAVLGGLVHAWARRDGGVGTRHALVLSGAVFVATAATFPLAGAHGTGLLTRYWLEMLLTCVLGIGVIARLFQDVVAWSRLAAEQQRFRAVLDEASDAIRIVEPDTLTILDCNRRDSEISGYPAHELIGRDVREFWPEDPPGRARREATIAEARVHGVARAFSQPYRRRSGEVIGVDATRRIVAHAGRRYEIVIYRESAEREAREASEREAGELKAVTLLASGAAHEINNPLAVVMGSLDLLGRRLSPETQEARWVGQALEGVRRIRDIVLRMRSITRVETTPAGGNLPPILDITKSATEPEKEVS